jgi:hypothetical protein
MSALQHIGKSLTSVTDGIEKATEHYRKTETKPLRLPPPAAAEYPLDALGSILAPAARCIRDIVQAPDALCATSLLSAASLAVQAHADVEIDGRREPLSLFAVSIAESGERKSAVDKIALHAHREIEWVALERYSQEKKSYDLDMQAWDAASRNASKGKSAEIIRSALSTLGPRPESPLKPILLVATPTLEGIHKLYLEGEPSIGLFHDDAGEFLGGHAMSKDNRTKSAAGLSRFWDTGDFDRIRSGDGAEKFYGRRLAMHLMMQPVIAKSILDDEVLTHQGFLARALMAWPISTIGTRLYNETDPYSHPDLKPYFARARELLTTPPQLKSGTRNVLAPRTLALTSEAKRLWIEAHDQIESNMKNGADFSGVRAWASKAPAQILRIAGVLTLIEDSKATRIEKIAITQATQIVHFHLSEAARIIGANVVPVSIRHAEALLEWCHKTGRSQLSSADALQLGPGCTRDRAALDAAMKELERTRWAIPIEGGIFIKGRHHRQVWTIQGIET